MPSSSKCVKYVTVHCSSHMEFSLLAVKASWFHVPGTPLFIVVFWFVPNGRGVLRRYLSESIHSVGGLLLERRKSESSPKKRFSVFCYYSDLFWANVPIYFLISKCLFFLLFVLFYIYFDNSALSALTLG